MKAEQRTQRRVFSWIRMNDSSLFMTGDTSFCWLETHEVMLARGGQVSWTWQHVVLLSKCTPEWMLRRRVRWRRPLSSSSLYIAFLRTLGTGPPSGRSSTCQSNHATNRQNGRRVPRKSLGMFLFSVVLYQDIRLNVGLRSAVAVGFKRCVLHT